MPPYPKPAKRIVDKSFYRTVIERDGACLWGLIAQDGCEGGLDAHHIVFRGRGGDDIPENGITLCRKHHTMAHQHKITPEQLQEVRDQYV